MVDISTIKIIRARRRSISLQILQDGSIEVKAPHLIPKRFIEEFVKSKADWIEKRLEHALKHKVGTKKFINGEKFLYLGKEYSLLLGNFIHIQTNDDKLLFPLAMASHGKTFLEKWYIRQAKLVIKDLVTEYSKSLNLPFESVSFSDTKSKWGSCTHDNRLQFNWKLIMTPLLVIRYVVIHELAHTKEKNHSTKFWRIVRSINPSYKLQIKWLKENGGGLSI